MCRYYLFRSKLKLYLFLKLIAILVFFLPNVVIAEGSTSARKVLPIITMLLLDDLDETINIEPPKLTTAPSSTTTAELIKIEVNGKQGLTVWLNGVQVATIEATGKVIIALDTSGTDGNKSFSLTLRDNAGNTSEAFSFIIEKVTISRKEAIKLLRQAAFRTTESEIEYIMANGYEAWIDNQLNMTSAFDSETDTQYGYLEGMFRVLNKYDSTLYPASLFRDPTLLDETIIDGKRRDVVQAHIHWNKGFNEDDQLRQRMAYALSQILVVSYKSPAGGALYFRGEALANYYDILYKHSFGNYRELLTDVTYSSAMGYYMTYIGSKKEAPDENYARELTQLFTLGLYELNNDGTPIMSGDTPIPSYNQAHVTNLSKVFTGWQLDDKQEKTTGNVPHPYYGSTGKTDNSWVSPLVFNTDTYQHGDNAGSLKYHDVSNKTILGNKLITGGNDGATEITQALDYLFAHRNVAPFISKHLIMRFVTSNPTPAYVGRITSVFNDNGQGLKGDLKAVIKAILLDPEARGTTIVNHFGKADELRLAFSHFLSAFNPQPVKMRINFDNNSTRIDDIYWIETNKIFGQNILNADSVFNFYSNEYVPSSTVFASNNLVAPELQIQSSPIYINYANQVLKVLTDREKFQETVYGGYADMGAWSDDKNFGGSYLSAKLYVDLTAEYEVFEKALDNETVANHDYANMGSGDKNRADRERAIDALLDHLDHKLLGGIMSDAYKTELKQYLETMTYPASTLGRKNRISSLVPTAIEAIVTSELFMIIK